MKVAVGSDMPCRLGEVVVEELTKRGIEIVKVGALVSGKEEPWPKVAQEVAELVASGECREGILMCWTGTGVCIVANKVPGIRAALCLDAETARGARKWNHANILVLSIRLVSEYVVKEILDAWFSTPWDEKEKPMIDLVLEVERKYCKEEFLRK